MLPSFPKYLDGKVETEGKGKGATVTDPSRKYFNCDEEYHWWVTHNHEKYNYETHQEFFERQEKYAMLSERIDQDEVLRYWNKWRADCRLLASQKKHAGYELGPREFTLTYSPDWFEDSKAMFFMDQAIHRLCNYYADEIVELRAVGERTKKGNAHVHCYYELKGGLKMTDKNMKRAYFKWNAKHHHHQIVRKTSDFKGYIEKDISNAWFQKIILPRVINKQDALSASRSESEEDKDEEGDDELPIDG